MCLLKSCIQNIHKDPTTLYKMKSPILRYKKNIYIYATKEYIKMANKHMKYVQHP